MPRPFVSLLLAAFAGISCIWGGTGTGGSSADTQDAPRTGSESAEVTELAQPTELVGDAAALEQGAGSRAAPATAARALEAAGEGDGDLRLDRGEGRLPLWIPRGEALDFIVLVDIGKLVPNFRAGAVELASGVERYLAGLPSAKSGKLENGREAAWLRSTARGSYGSYDLDHELKARLLPQEFPRVYYTDTQRGSEARRRELKLGHEDGRSLAWFRNDGHCRGCENKEHFVDSFWAWGKPAHCEDCSRLEHRTWRDPKQREVPEGSVDMLSAVYLARSLLREGKTSETIQLVDRQRVWNVQLALGKQKTLEVPAGKFVCREVKLITSLPKGEEPTKSGFEGMFGIRGTIQIWFDAKTGVPVQIEGELPVKVLGDITVLVQLARYKGTPAGFGPN